MLNRPLFDELLTHDGAGEGAKITLGDRQGMKASIARELQLLISTRTLLPANQLSQRRRTTIDYGVPDFSTFQTSDMDGIELLCRHIEQSIIAYEPRLSDPRASIVKPTEHDSPVELQIEATLMDSRERERVSFVLAVNPSQPVRNAV